MNNLSVPIWYQWVCLEDHSVSVLATHTLKARKPVSLCNFIWNSNFCYLGQISGFPAFAETKWRIQSGFPSTLFSHGDTSRTACSVQLFIVWWTELTWVICVSKNQWSNTEIDTSVTASRRYCSFYSSRANIFEIWRIFCVITFVLRPSTTTTTLVMTEAHQCTTDEWYWCVFFSLCNFFFFFLQNPGSLER